MKFFQKRAVAAVVLILAIVAGVVIGQAKKPDTGGQASTAIVGSYTYVYDYAGVLTDETMEHIDAMNASLFAQTGAQILVSVVNSTGGADIMDYASDLGNSYGVGSAERNNGVVMLLALDNISQSGLMGDYCVVVGAGLESHADDFMSLQSYYLENDFAAGEYDAGVKATFDAFIAWFADFYGVTIREGYIPAVRETYSSGSGYYYTETHGYVAPAFGSLVSGVVVLLVVLLVLWVVAARVLTTKLVAPIEKLAQNIGECTEMQTYEELTPFMTMIRKQHEDIMKNARMRQEFSANVSHELKTPLTSISGYAELIETGMASEQDTVRFAHGIHNSANRLLTLINDIIRLSELDGTEEEADTELLNLHEMAQNCVEMLKMSAEKHKVTIALNGTECYVTANRQMMEELLYNLCDNAIRYNNPGGSVDVQTYAREGHTYLVVKDTGIGISKEHQERIFERFYRVDKSRSKSTGGTGLGLAIVKHIIAKSHAELELESEPGKGTTIRVIF
mgnify:CR=1 FL=1